MAHLPTDETAKPTPKPPDVMNILQAVDGILHRGDVAHVMRQSGDSSYLHKVQRELHQLIRAQR